MASTNKSLRQSTGVSLIARRVLGETREVEKDCRISASCHFSAATFWYTFYYALGLPATVLAAVAGVSALRGQELVAAVLAISVAALTATTTFLNAGERAHSHSRKRAQYEELKNDTRVFRQVGALQMDDSQLAGELERLTKRRNLLNRESPQVRRKFFEQAGEMVARELERERRRGRAEAAPVGLTARFLGALFRRFGASEPTPTTNSR